jgi:hypothetical protein
MSLKLENKDSTGVDKDPFTQMSVAVERLMRKKKSYNEDDSTSSNPETIQKPAEHAEASQSKASADAAAVVMAHWSEQKTPAAAPLDAVKAQTSTMDTLTTADRQRKQDKRRVVNDPKNSAKDEADKKAEPSKEQSVE